MEEKEEKILYLVKRARAHDEQSMEELIRLLKPKVIAIAREYFLVGADFDDLLQEGMIGLYKAIMVYDETKNHNFNMFASLCIHRQIQNAVKLANRKKNAPLNQYISINNYGKIKLDGEENLTLIIEDGGDIEKNFVSKEMNGILLSKVQAILNDEQFALLKLFLNGATYQEMAQILDKSTKQVDNMLQAIKKKLKGIKGDE